MPDRLSFPANHRVQSRAGADRRALDEQELRNVRTGMLKLFAPANDHLFDELLAEIDRSAPRRRRA